MKQRVITGAILIALFLPFVILGGIPYTVLMTIAIGFGMYELLKATEGKIEKNEEKKRCLSWPKWIIALVIIITMVGSIYPYLVSLVNGNGFTFSSVTIPVIPFVVLAFLLFSGSVFSERINIQDVTMVLGMSTFLMVGGQSLSLVRDMGGAFLVFVLLTCFITDAGAYFTGYICSKNFKTHKLNERISPKKTIEGSIGGMVLGTLIPFLVTLIPLLSMENDAVFGISLKWWMILILSFIMTITAQIGDLTFSAIKRHYDVKDYSQLFPGHGGVLDRFDSILFNMIFFSVIVMFLASGTII
jgi:phosphatidate cytidylyltransferase